MLAALGLEVDPINGELPLQTRCPATIHHSLLLFKNSSISTDPLRPLAVSRKDLELLVATMSATLKVGDSIPSGTTFSYVPYTPESSAITSCGIPINYDASKGNSALFSVVPIMLASFLSTNSPPYHLADNIRIY